MEALELDCHMLLTVHDELVFEVPEDQVEEASALVRTQMEGAYASSAASRRHRLGAELGGGRPRGPLRGSPGVDGVSAGQLPSLRREATPATATPNAPVPRHACAEEMVRSRRAERLTEGRARARPDP